MNTGLILLVLSSILAPAITRDFTKFIKRANADLVTIYKGISNKTDSGSNLLIGSNDQTLISYFIEFKEINDCNVISGVTTKLTVPSWKNNKVELKSQSVLVNDYNNQVHEYFQGALEQIDAAKKTRIIMGQSHTENTNGVPPNLVSTLKKNNSVLFEAIFNVPSNAEKTFNDSTLEKTVHTVGRYQYYENAELEAKFLSLPLLFENMSLTIVVPNSGKLYKLEQQLEQVLATPEYEFSLVSVSLPLFSLTTEINLKGVFDTDKPDTGDRFRQISSFTLSKDVAEKTDVSVDEAVPLQKFQAKAPFMFYVKINDFILFIGRVVSTNN